MFVILLVQEHSTLIHPIVILAIQLALIVMAEDPTNVHHAFQENIYPEGNA